jgi:hypothetical protein
MISLHLLQTIVNDTQVAQAKKVHLEKPEGFARGVIELGDGAAILAGPQGHVIDQGLCRDDHASRVNARLTHQAFYPKCGIHHASNVHLRLI